MPESPKPGVSPRNDTDRRSYSERIVKPKIFLFFNIISLVTILIGTLTTLAQIFSLAYVKDAPGSRKTLDLYGLFFCMTVLFIELEFPKVIRENILSKSFVARGLYYVFIGLLVYDTTVYSCDGEPSSLEQYYPNIDSYITAITVMMMSIGSFYFLMGISCMKKKKDKILEEYNKLKEEAQLHDRLKTGRV